MIFQSRTQRIIVGAGAAIAFSVLFAIGFCLLRGMRYDFDRGLVVSPMRNGTSIGRGVCYQDGLPTLCCTIWRSDGSISETGFGRFKNWRSLWADFDVYKSLYGEETHYYENGNRKTFGILQDEDDVKCVELWSWHPNGEISSHFESRDLQIEGPMRAWYSSGQLKFEMPMKAGMRDGRVRWFAQSGELIAQCVCRNDEGIEGDFITWYGDTGFDGDIFFGPADGRDYVIKHKSSHHNGKLIKEQFWNRQGELVGVGRCRDGKEWEGIFSSDSSDNDSNMLTDLSIWENGSEIAQVPFNEEATPAEIEEFVAKLRGHPGEESDLEIEKELNGFNVEAEKLQ